MDFSNFPAELRARPQWCVATLQPLAGSKLDKRPLNARTGAAASPTDPKTWSTFEEAIATRDAWRAGDAPNAQIGFVFAVDDPFAVIDLDTYKATLDKTRELHAYILQQVGDETYTEPSQSGQGTHIIGYGVVGTGINNEANALELYSSGRFMICTGKGHAPLGSVQVLIDDLRRMLERVGDATKVHWRDLGDGEDSGLSDAEVIERASNADNGDKFDRLCNGDMSDYGNDWSDADAALIEYLCFYSSDNIQVARLFHMSKLAERDKAHRPDYVPRTIAAMRAKLASEAIPMVDASAIQQRALAETARVSAPSSAVNAAPPAPAQSAPLVGKAPHGAAVTFPPGLVGEIARYVLGAAILPVPEIALAAAIGVVAGIAGRQYNCSTPGTGLNQYILLLAKTGTGKETVQASIDRLFAEVQKTVPIADRFLGPAHFASGPALVKTFQEKPCFVSVMGEFGHRLRAMTHPRAIGAEKTLMAAMLDLFAKSGWGQVLRASQYSDKEKNTVPIHAPALTLLGETEPDGFFSNLDESMISSGFLPRFLMIEYTGERPPRNRTPQALPPSELVTKVADLVTSVLGAEQAATVTQVLADDASAKLLDGFYDHADAAMRGQNDIVRQLWNRAHMKAVRLASLVAVGVNPYQPTITEEAAVWAISMVKDDIAALQRRFEIGDVGEGDAKLRADLVTIIRRYLSDGSKRYTLFHDRHCVPLRFLMQQTANRPAFKNHKLGATRAVKDTLAAMVESGALVQVPKKQTEEWFKTSSAVFALGDLWED